MPRTFLLAASALLALAACGCGGKFVEVKGVVKLDGKPVEGATVSFVSEDGAKSYSGQTDANGEFTLSGGPRSGAPNGTYKVTVTKTAKVSGAEQMAPGGEDYVKHMKDESKGDKKTTMAGPGAKGPPGMKGMPMMPGMPMPVGGGAGPKSDLPTLYASASTTPLTVTVNSDMQPVQLDLKSKQ
jgi:hypothetical protein